MAADRIYTRVYDDGAEAVPRSFVERKSQNQSFFGRVVARRGGDHMDIGISVSAIEAAQQVAIDLDFVRVVEIVIQQETQKIGLASFDGVFQLVGRERAI